jgi:hypothetical protein
MTRMNRPVQRTSHIDKRMLHARGMTDNNLFGSGEVNPRPLGGQHLTRAWGYGLDVQRDVPTWIAVFWGGEVQPGRVEVRGWRAAEVMAEVIHHAGEMLVTLDLTQVRLDVNDPAALLAAFTVLLPSDRATFAGDLPPGAARTWLPPDCVF